MVQLFEHPTTEPIIIIRPWQLELCDGNECAAAILSFFEFATACKLETIEQNKEQNKRAKAHGVKPILPEDLLIWYTEEQLEKKILIYKRKTIREALRFLESKNLISIHKNPHTQYGYDRTKHFLLNIEVIQDYLTDYKERNSLLNKAISAISTSGKNTSTSGKNASTSGKNASPIPKISSKITTKNLKIPPTPQGEEAEEDGNKVAASSLRSEGAVIETSKPTQRKPKSEKELETNRIRGELIRWTRENTGVEPIGRELQAVGQLAQMGVVPEIAIACYLDIASSSLAVKGWCQVVTGYSAFVLAYNGSIKRRLAGQIKSRTEQTIENANLAFAVMADRKEQGLEANPLDEILGTSAKQLTEGDNDDEYDYSDLEKPLS